MDKEEKAFIDSLLDRNATDADIISSIEVLEVLLTLEALPSLVNLIVDESRPFDLRERAAKAINRIGSDSVNDRLLEMKYSHFDNIQKLAKVALEG